MAAPVAFSSPSSLLHGQIPLFTKPANAFDIDEVLAYASLNKDRQKLIIFIWYVVILFPAWFLIHLSAAWLKFDIRRLKKLRPSGYSLWVVCGGNESMWIPRSRAYSIARCSSYGKCARRGFSGLGSSYWTEHVSGSVSSKRCMIHAPSNRCRCWRSNCLVARLPSTHPASVSS